MNAFTRGSRGSQSCVPSSEQESCTICSTSTPCWSATDAMQSLSQFELRKLGVTMENFTPQSLARNPSAGKCWRRKFLPAPPSFQPAAGDRREGETMGVQPAGHILPAGDFTAQDGEDQIVGRLGVELPSI